MIVVSGPCLLVTSANQQADVELHPYRLAGLVPGEGASAVSPRGCATRESITTVAAAEGSRCPSFWAARTSKSP